MKGKWYENEKVVEKLKVEFEKSGLPLEYRAKKIFEDNGFETFSQHYKFPLDGILDKSIDEKEGIWRQIDISTISKEGTSDVDLQFGKTRLVLTADFIREVEPGELVVIDNDTLINGEIKSFYFNDDLPAKNHCVFEYIYFSRPDSFIFGHNVDKMRRRLGKSLARNHPVYNEDEKKVIVISVPDSSNTTALGYQTELEKLGVKCRLEIGLIRSHYIGRTFIQPGQSNREIGVRIKFNTVKGVLEGRTVVIVDDSIVRGTTSKQLVKLIREANPKSIHLRISSPPITHPCFYGMDFPSKEELIAHRYHNNIEEIREYLGVDTLHYLTNDEMLDAVSEAGKDNFCHACFSGNYPAPVDINFNKEIYEV